MSQSKQNRKRKARKNQPELVQPKAKKRFVVPVVLTGLLVVLAGTFSVHALASAFLSVKYRPVSLSSGSASDENVQTNFTYDGLGNVVTQTAVNPTTGNQTTRYLYEDPYDATLPTSIIYPDSSDTNSNGTDQVKITYYLDKNIRTISDQNGTLRTFSYDHQRRLAADTVTTLGTGVDGTVRKITRTYNSIGLLERLSSRDNSDNVLNEVMYTYNANQDLHRIYQSHSGAVNTNTTPYIEYGYSPLVRGRLATVTYPSGKILTYNYDALGRVNAIQDGQQTVVSYGIDGAGRLLQVTYNEPGLSLDYVGGGMDRHARVAEEERRRRGSDQA